MSNLFKFQKLDNDCNCLLAKKDKKDKQSKVSFKCSDNLSDIYYWKNYVYECQGNSGNKYDILFLSEFPEFKKDSKLLTYFKSYLKSAGINSYTIIPALKCYAKNRQLKNPVCMFYGNCNAPSYISDYKKYKIIVPLGKALFSITQNKHIQSWEDFSQYIFDMPTYFFDNFGRRVYPLPSFFSFVFGSEENIELTFKYRFFFQQLKRIKNFLNSYESPKLSRGIQIIKVSSAEHISEILKKLKDTDFAFDIETTGFDWWKDEIICITFSNQDNMAYFVDWKYMNNSNKKLLNECFLSNYRHIGFNVTFDSKFLIQNDIKNAIGNEDAMIMHHLINEDRPQSLNFNAYEFTQFGGYSEELEKCKIKLGKKYIDYGSLYKYFPKEFIKYASYDSAITFIAWKKMRNQLKTQKLEKFYYDILIPAIETFTNMEMNGLRVDLDYIKKYVEKIRIDKNNLEKEVYNEIGEEINLDSSKEISHVLKKKGIPVAIDEDGNELYTKTGDYKLDKDTILLYSEYPFIKKLIEYNHLSKLINQLGDEEIYKSDNRQNSFTSSIVGKDSFKEGFYKKIYGDLLYISYSLIGTKYGRVSSKGGINAQNFPKDKEFRKIFIPRKDSVFIEFDFDNAEMRLISMIADEKNMQDAFNKGYDLHCYTSAIMENIPYDDFYQQYKTGNEKYKEIRQGKKAVNFGILYGQQKYGLAYRLNKEIKDFNLKLKEDQANGLRLNENYKVELSIDEAQDFIDDYFKLYPHIKSYIAEYRSKATQKGYIRNPFGRVAHFHKLHGLKYDSKIKYDKTTRGLLNTAINCPIQGSCGIALIHAMNLIYKKFKELNIKSKIVAQVHDSILIDIKMEEIELVMKIVKECMEVKHDFYGNVNMRSDETIGNIWGYGKNYEVWKQKINKNKREILIRR